MFKPSAISFFHCRSLKKKTRVRRPNKRKTTWFQCDQCSFETINKSYLKCHSVVHKSLGQVQVYSCSYCHFLTINKSLFHKHELVHKDGNEFEMYKSELKNIKFYKSIHKKQ